MPPKTRCCVSVIIFALFFPLWQLGAIGNNLDGNAVYLSVFQAGGEDLSKLREIIYDSAAIKLHRIGYQTYSPAADGENRLWHDQVDALYSEAGNSHASSIILVTYTTDDVTAVMNLRLFDVKNEKERAARSLSSKIDLAFDEVIARSLDELIADSGIDPPSVSDKSYNSDKSSRSGNSPNHSVAAPGLTVGGEIPSVATVAASHKLFHVSAGFAPFIAVGDTARYFSIGMEPSVLAGLQFRAPFDFLQLGVLLRATLFKAHGVLLETDNYLFSAAPDVRFTLASASTSNLYLHLAGGASGFVLNNETIGEYWEIIPFASGGVGLSFRLSSVFGFTFIVDYSVYFEQSIFIMGISPSAHAAFKF